VLGVTASADITRNTPGGIYVPDAYESLKNGMVCLRPAALVAIL
jgi:hypothetical protein